MDMAAETVNPTNPSLADCLITELGKVIVGQDDNVALIMATLLSGGHVLLEDRPGVGKTVLARSISQVLGLPMARIQGTPDLLPTDITGVHIFDPNSTEWTFRSGPIFAPLVLVDELNRATAKAQAALLEAMAEGQVTVEGKTMPLPNPFLVIATQNPLGDSGTYRLGAAQVDRFATQVSLGLPNAAAEREIVMGLAGTKRSPELHPLLTEEQLPDLIANIHGIHVAEPLVDYALLIVQTLRLLVPGVWLSVRVSETLLNTARGLAFMDNRDFVTPEDLQKAALPVVRHRIAPSVETDLIQSAIERPSVPVHGV